METIDGGWMTKISLSCFAFSYAIAMILEISRLFFRAPVRFLIIVGLTVAGIFAHTVYLWLKFQKDFSGGTPMSSWYDWCLMVSLAVAVIYAIIAIKKNENSIGIFFLPLILLLILVALFVKDQDAFTQSEATSIWAITHGISLLFGTSAMIVAFVAGVMYLVHAFRLKKKLPPRVGFRLPSLEWLEQCNRFSLFFATALIGAGLVSGAIMNILQNSESQSGIPWSNSVIISSAILLLWLIIITVFEALYKPARQGRKIAYLTVASFVFLAMVLCFVFMAEHAGQNQQVSCLWEAWQ
ncbi:MAG: cytochrome C assembly protein [Planctomycetaceae bacterium]|nr:cytochrome C assembly protein [Planctomycetaceae bacterium]|tara:strand:+ start:3201 stop:4091 length:891 start_codon:yes stop_codon:yes gene_type:complete